MHDRLLVKITVQGGVASKQNNEPINYCKWTRKEGEKGAEPVKEVGGALELSLVNGAANSTDLLTRLKRRPVSLTAAKINSSVHGPGSYWCPNKDVGFQT